MHQAVMYQSRKALQVTIIAHFFIKPFIHFLLSFQHFESVTIMFSYLDGFDHICANVTPMEVVNLVNKMFLTFDKLSEKHDVYKVSSLTEKINRYVTIILRQFLDAVLICILGILLRHPSTAERLSLTVVRLKHSTTNVYKKRLQYNLTSQRRIHTFWKRITKLNKSSVLKLSKGSNLTCMSIQGITTLYI